MVLNVLSEEEDEDEDEEDEPGRTFLAVPAQVCSIDANLGISNMDFSEFADSVDPRRSVPRLPGPERLKANH